MTGVESITRLKEPTLDVVLNPVRDTTDSKFKVKEPTLDVVLNPVSCTNLLNESP